MSRKCKMDPSTGLKIHVFTCKCCGQKFETTDSHQIICNRSHTYICKVCGKEFPVESKYSIPSVCDHCQHILMGKASQAPKAKKKRQQTSLERYGVTNPGQSKIAREKKKQHCLENYGVEYITQTKQFKEKTKQTSLKRYGASLLHKLRCI